MFSSNPQDKFPFEFCVISLHEIPVRSSFVCCTPSCCTRCSQFVHFGVFLNQQWLRLPLFRVCFHFSLPVAKSYILSKKLHFWFWLRSEYLPVHWTWSCEIMLCATSYLEQGFYQTDMLFKDFSLGNSSQNEKFGVVKQMLLLTGCALRTHHLIS